MFADFAKLSAREKYKLLIATVMLRLIALRSVLVGGRPFRKGFAVGGLPRS